MFEMLSIEQMQQAVLAHPELPMGEAVARKAEENMKRQIVEWGDEDCYEHAQEMRAQFEKTTGYKFKRWECPECWEKLREMAER